MLFFFVLASLMNWFAKINEFRLIRNESLKSIRFERISLKASNQEIRFGWLFMDTEMILNDNQMSIKQYKSEEFEKQWIEPV